MELNTLYLVMNKHKDDIDCDRSHKYTFYHHIPTIISYYQMKYVSVHKTDEILLHNTYHIAYMYFPYNNSYTTNINQIYIIIAIIPFQ